MCEQAWEGGWEWTGTSMWYWNAFKSLNLNELPMDIVWELIREAIVHK